MGAPSLDYFCENGHHIFSVPHGYIDENVPDECPICDSKKIRSVMEWGDSDYECGKIVPTTQITFDVLHIPAHDEIISVYDVSKLFKEKQ